LLFDLLLLAVSLGDVEAMRAGSDDDNDDSGACEYDVFVERIVDVAGWPIRLRYLDSLSFCDATAFSDDVDVTGMMVCNATWHMVHGSHVH
jgi:hypothetical protein